MIWFTADHHFGHKNILALTGRPFASIDAHDMALIRVWNTYIAPQDRVYYLGDLTLSTNRSYVSDLLQALNGNIFFLPGNHDYWLKKPSFAHVQQLPAVHTVKDQEPEIVLCHYAMRTWPGIQRGAIQLYGHSHGTLPDTPQSMDVGVDTNNFRPYSLPEILKRMEQRGRHWQHYMYLAMAFGNKLAEAIRARRN